MNIEDLHSLVSETLVNHIQNQALAEPKILKIVLIGKTGEGKSSTGNSLLKEKRFLQKFGLKPGTRETSGETTTLTVDGTEYQLVVIDTPGLFDTSDQEEVQAQIRRCIFIDSNHSNALIGSIHAFFLVMKTDSRFTPEMQNTLDVIATMFGGLHMNPYLFVVFTKADEMAANGITEEEFMREHVDDEVLIKIKETGNDPIFVNNQLMDDLNSNGDQVDNWRQDVVRRILSNLENRLHYVPYSYINFVAEPIQSKASHLRKMFEPFETWKDELIEYLNKVEKEYEQVEQNTRAVGISASAFSLGVGFPLMIAGIALAGPSLGLSTMLTGAGAVVSTLGNVVAGGGAIQGHRQRTELDQQAENKVKSFFENAILLSGELNRVRIELLEAKIRLWPALLAMKLNEETDRAQEGNLSALNLADSGVVSIAYARVLTGAGQAALMTALASSNTTLKLIGTAVRVIPIVGNAVGAVADLISFALSAPNRYKSEEKAIEKFDELRKELNKFIADIQTELETLLAELEVLRSKPESIYTISLFTFIFCQNYLFLLTSEHCCSVLHVHHLLESVGYSCGLLSNSDACFWMLKMCRRVASEGGEPQLPHMPSSMVQRICDIR